MLLRTIAMFPPALLFLLCSRTIQSEPARTADAISTYEGAIGHPGSVAQAGSSTGLVISPRAEQPVYSPHRAPTCPPEWPAQHDWCLDDGARRRLWKRVCFQLQFIVYGPQVRPLFNVYLCPWDTECVQRSSEPISLAVEDATAGFSAEDARGRLRRGRARISCTHRYLGLRTFLSSGRRTWWLRGDIARAMGLGQPDAAADIARENNQFLRQSIVMPVATDFP